MPLNKNKGELSYQKPDKGSFQITEVDLAGEPCRGTPAAKATGS